MIVIAAVDNKRQPLAFGGCCCRLWWQWQWQSSTAAIAVVVNVDNHTARWRGLTNLKADNAAGKGQQTTQQPTIDRSIGGAMTLAKAAVMVTAEARARAWWRRHWRRRQRRAVVHHPVVVVVVDGSGKDVIAAAAINHHCSGQ
jgi:hypothetical protein